MPEQISEQEWDESLEEAREYGRKQSPSHVCAACVEIDLQPWQDERLKEIAGWETDADYKPFFRDPPVPPTGEHRYLFNEVFEAFSEAFHDNAADPEDCDVCIDGGIECGHEMHGDGCPV